MSEYGYRQRSLLV